MSETIGFVIFLLCLITPLNGLHVDETGACGYHTRLMFGCAGALCNLKCKSEVCRVRWQVMEGRSNRLQVLRMIR